MYDWLEDISDEDLLQSNVKEILNKLDYALDPYRDVLARVVKALNDLGMANTVDAIQQITFDPLDETSIELGIKLLDSAYKAARNQHMGTSDPEIKSQLERLSIETQHVRTKLKDFNRDIHNGLLQAQAALEGIEDDIRWISEVFVDNEESANQQIKSKLNNAIEILESVDPDLDSLYAVYHRKLMIDQMKRAHERVDIMTQKHESLGKVVPRSQSESAQSIMPEPEPEPEPELEESSEAEYVAEEVVSKENVNLNSPSNDEPDPSPSSSATKSQSPEWMNTGQMSSAKSLENKKTAEPQSVEVEMKTLLNGLRNDLINQKTEEYKDKTVADQQLKCIVQLKSHLPLIRGDDNKQKVAQQYGVKIHLARNSKELKESILNIKKDIAKDRSFSIKEKRVLSKVMRQQLKEISVKPNKKLLGRRRKG